MTDSLPRVITECDEYAALSEEDRASFIRRLRSSRALGSSLSTGHRKVSYPDFFQFVEDLELDLSHLQEFDSPSRINLSRWATHYSWTFYASPAEMRNSISESLLRLINADEPTTDSALIDTEQWMAELGQGLVSAVDAIVDANTYTYAMAHQIALDILLSRLLVTCYRLRLNRLVPR